MDYRISFIFSKTKPISYISHLDLMRLLTRAMRRARIPMKISCGFNPHPKLSIKRALKLGLESEGEEAVIALREFLKPAEFKERLSAELPAGITIKDARLI